VRNVCLRLPDKLIEDIDVLVDRGVYASRTEALREGARMLLRMQVCSLEGLPREVSKDEIWEEFRKKSDC
jgi:Arc/MetJ-type ribon-helix-helix transcriptional regulator